MIPQITLNETRELITSAVDWFVVTGLRNRFRLRYFVETGTGGGITVRNASSVFEHAWSIEVDPNRLATAKEYCQGVPNVTLLLGDSVRVLPQVCKELGDNPTLFYLDAHWCGGERVGSVECPLIDELACLRQRNGDVIMIDNAGYLIHPPTKPHRSREWPTIREVVAVVRRYYPRATARLLIDQIIITPEPLLTVYWSATSENLF